MTAPATTSDIAVGSLVRARGREWVVQPGGDRDFLLLQPLGGSAEDVAGVFRDEGIEPATFPPPTLDDLGDSAATDLLRTALRVGFTGSAGPFRSLAGLAVSPRSYQYVPLLMALKQETVRLLIADDVGIGKTVEAGLIAAELLAQGSITRLAVLCSPALAEQWQRELRDKFGIDAALVLTSTVKALERGLMLSESLFEKYPYVIVSSDFIKSERRRHEFLLRCPELVIVDEAHNSVAGGGLGGRATHQRYELLRQLAADESRHLILATATPHSGDEQAFRNLVELCNPALATADFGTETGRALLARHLVQRRRADIRSFLGEDTPFPSDRLTKDVPYHLSPAYRDLFDDVLAYARQRVTDDATGKRSRIAWWSALALLRALASSPRAAALTLRTRAKVADFTDDVATVEDIDTAGRAAVLDASDDENLEGLDSTPGALIDDHTDMGAAGSAEAGTSSERRRLLAFARRAEQLEGVGADRKLAAVTAQVRQLLKDGERPIVFCRFIHTADYVAEHLATALGSPRKPVAVAAVTGELPPPERERRVTELADSDGDYVLVATDCLSEGVNLQESFTAVLHYDLAWNPTRHEQREGRVDRFGQRRDIVKAITIYGADNAIDGIVLDVLIKKHRAIAKATGVAVPVPGDGQALIDALAEGLLLRGGTSETLPFDFGLETGQAALDAAWQSAAEQEKRSRARYAQHAIKTEEIEAEIAEVRAALGSHGDLHAFVTTTLRRIGSTVTPVERGGYTATLATLPPLARAALPVALKDPLPLSAIPPALRGEAALVRTDPTVRALARYVLESALDDAAPQPGDGGGVARRAGVMRTDAVTTRTTLLLVRLRFQLALPAAGEPRRVVAEDALVIAFEGAPNGARWLADSQAEALLAAEPTGNVAEGAAQAALQRITDGLPDAAAHLDAVADERAEQLYAAHRRVRTGSGAALRGLAVTAQHPVDVLSVQVLLPTATGVGE
jgi:superfamily II DNA or RNA helicase